MIAVFASGFALQTIGVAAPQEAISSPLNLTKNYRALPLSFEANHGQVDAQARFLSRGAGYSLFLTDKEAVLALSKTGTMRPAPHGLDARRTALPLDANSKTDAIRMRLAGSRSTATPTGEDPLPGTANYFLGNDPAKWHSGVVTFAKVKYAGVYPGVDLVYYGTQQRLEFDFEVAPGADAKAIHLHFAGARRLKLDAEGNLIILAMNGEASFHRPVIYQIADGRKHLVAGMFRLARNSNVSFNIGAYDHGKPLVIDPVLSYSTYFGGSDAGANAVAVDSEGNAYVTGRTFSQGFPTTPGAFQQPPTKPGLTGAFITKFNSTGTAILYSTYLGGRLGDAAYAIALDTAGNAYVTGLTDSPDFPTTTGAFQVKNNTGKNFTGFVSKVNSTGTALLYSTYLGGTTSLNTVDNAITILSQDQPNGIAVDADGSAYVSGNTSSSDFPTTHGAFQTQNKAGALAYLTTFLTKLNAAGTSLVYSTYLGGSGRDGSSADAIDKAGDAYVVGGSSSPDFPTTPGVYQSKSMFADGGGAFLAEMNSTGTGLVYSTFLDGGALENINALCMDSGGNIYVTGSIASAGLPVTAGAFQPSLNGTGINAFVTKVNNSGTRLEYSTYLGGSRDGLGGVGQDEGLGIAVDSDGNASVAGRTFSIDFPTTRGALQAENYSLLNSGNIGSFLTRFNSDGTALLYSTYLSGSGDLSGESCDCANGVAMDNSGNVYVAGLTVSTDFPTTPGAFQTSPGGVFVTKFNASELKLLPGTNTTVATNVNPQANGSPVVITARVQAAAGGGAPSGTIGFSLNGGPWSDYSLDATGSAGFTTSTLGSGSNIIYAYYLGDENNAPSNGFATVKITPLASTLNVTSGENPVMYGMPVTFTAAVQDSAGNGISGGSLVFAADGSEQFQADVDSTGHATWTTSRLAAGTNIVYAAYADYSGKYAGSSATVTENITPLGITPTPVFSPPGGTYTSTQLVSISDSNPGATIYYTTNGSSPAATPTSTTQWYLQPIGINANQTLKAIAIADGYSPSVVGTAAYILNLPPPDFTISLSPASVVVTGLQSAQATVTVAAISGFNQPVSFACTSLPAGVSCSFSPTTVAPSQAAGATTLTFTASPSASTTTPGPLPSSLAATTTATAPAAPHRVLTPIHAPIKVLT